MSVLAGNSIVSKTFFCDLKTTHFDAVPDKTILWQAFCERVGGRQFGAAWKNLHDAGSYSLTKMMVTNSDVIVLGQSFGGHANSSAPELSANTLQYT